MVKRTKNAKNTCEVAMIAKTTSLGVCTRAKTMRLKKSSFSRSTSAVIEDITTNKGGDVCYLQLRSRRLERRAPPFTKKARKKKCTRKEKVIDFRKEIVGISFEKKPKDKGGIASKKPGENGVVVNQEKEFEREEKNRNDEKDDFDEKDKGSFGENDLGTENKKSGRFSRESTPCNLIVSSDIATTPTSSNRKTINGNTIKKTKNEVPIMPSTAKELEEFFAKADYKSHIEIFIKKYNFDPVNEKPLEGLYEWEKIKP